MNPQLLFQRVPESIFHVEIHFPGGRSNKLRCHVNRAAFYHQLIFELSRNLREPTVLIRVRNSL